MLARWWFVRRAFGAFAFVTPSARGVIVTPQNSAPRCTIILYYTHFIGLYYIIDNIYGGAKGGQYNPVEKAADSLSTEKPAPFRLRGMTRLDVDFFGFIFVFLWGYYCSLEANFTFCVDRILRFRLLRRYRSEFVRFGD